MKFKENSMLNTIEQETFYKVLGNVVNHAIKASNKLPNVAMLPESCRDLPEVIDDTIKGMKVIKYLPYTGIMVAHAGSSEHLERLKTCKPYPFTWEECKNKSNMDFVSKNKCI